MKNHLFLFSFLLFSGLIYTQNLNSNTTGSFIFTPQSPVNRPPIEVFYHIPSGNITTMPILMSFHGANRDGANYRDYWISMANSNGFMVFAPEFTNVNYPGLGDNYLMGNVFVDGDNPTQLEFNDPNEWTFSVIEPLFEYIKNDISGVQETYSAWGHSGGAQFLHRFALFVPDSKLGIGVCSNSGWYTVPESGVDYPYGTGLPFGSTNEDLFIFFQNLTTPLNVTLEQFFGKELVIHLGTNDTDPNSPALRHNDILDAQQGLNRYVRGQYFFNTSQTTSTDIRLPFNWEKHEVTGIGHNAQLMANDALQFFLPNILSVDSVEENKFIKIYPNPIYPSYINFSTNLSTPISVSIYNIMGIEIFKRIIEDHVLNVSNLDTGIYFIKIQSNTFSTTKKIIKK